LHESVKGVRLKGAALNEKYLQDNIAHGKKQIKISLYNEMFPGIPRTSVIIKVVNHIH
jgi:hypothetical protein